MKKVLIALFIIGMIFGLVDVDNMTVFFATKVIGILFMLPACFFVKFEE